METKKLIGYKLVKPEYEEAAKKICNKDVKWTENDKFNLSILQNISIHRLKEAGVLDLWFKPVYEEEQFKVGDFIALEYNTHRFIAKKGYVAKVIKELDGKYINIKWITDTDQIDGEYYPSDFRKATLEEIEEANKKIVKMYSSNKGEFEIEVIDGVAYYRPENKYLPKEWIRDIINSFGETIICNTKKENPYNVTISSLNVGCYHDCKKEDWEKIYKLLK